MSDIRALPDQGVSREPDECTYDECPIAERHYNHLPVDRAGNLICGQDFMAGTICSDVPGHEGGHSARCQTCGGDWINETCTCPKDWEVVVTFSVKATGGDHAVQLLERVLEEAEFLGITGPVSEWWVQRYDDEETRRA